MRETVRFLLGDELVEIGSCSPTATLLEWLRTERGLAGAKEGCAEGDCGACTVAIGRPDGDGVRYEAINACLRFLPTLDGCRVLTVESLREGGALHPVQQAIVDRHGSQCGFCTPGFVMSLFCLALNEDRPDRDRVETAIAGNLCRCTGYGPIVEAGLAAAATGGTRASIGAAARLRLLQDEEIVTVAEGERRFFAPATSAQLAALLAEHPGAVLVNGATDVGLWVTKEMRLLEGVIYLGRIAELRRIAEDERELVIGAGASLTEAYGRLAAFHPHLGELMRRFGGEQIRNAGTIGGNIANGSPIGDLAPALIALDGTLVLGGPGGRRERALQEFFIGYGQQDRNPGEFVAAVRVPRLRAGQIFHVSKVSKRFDEDISTLCGAFRLTLGGHGEVTEARLAYGGMAAVPKRAGRAEAALIGRPFDEDAADAAAAALAGDFTPLDDWRASSRYRLAVAGNLLRRFAVEAGGTGTATRVAGPLAAAASVEAALA